MELTHEYLDKQTLLADFWIADSENQIQSFLNEGITIEKSKIYLKKYFINVYIKKEYHHELDKYALGWQDRYPKVVITRGTGRVEAYELKFKSANEKENFMVLEFAGELIE